MICLFVCGVFLLELVGLGAPADSLLSVSSVAPALSPGIVAEDSPDVIAINGRDIRLSCRVQQLNNKTVSWIRHRDTHLLTVGRYLYTSDRRFSAHHPVHGQDWQLRIMRVSHRDQGRYECQISTTPPIGHFVHLSIVDPETEIIGGPDMFIDQGSTINLTCVARFTPGHPEDVLWYHNKKEISFSGPRPGVSSVTEKGDKTVSQLLIQRAQVSDSGDYKCHPLGTFTANITLHVLRGKHPAAIQRGSHCVVCGFYLTVISFFVSYLVQNINTIT